MSITKNNKFQLKFKSLILINGGYKKVKVNISTLGSCSSRNIFFSNLNENYKDYFKINKSIEAVTFISLMSKSFQYDKNLINSNSDYDNYCVFEDLSKDFLNFLKKKKIEYLIIDTYFDVFYEVIVVGKDSFISDSERLSHTDLYNTFKNKKRINIQDDFEEYFYHFKKALSSFFKFIENNCSNIKIILNCSRAVSKYERDGVIIDDENLKKLVSLNKFRDILDKYILENFDVDVLSFDETTLADQNHIFGLHSTHYEHRYYLDKTKQLNQIIARYNLLDYSNEINIQFRNIERRNVLLQFNQNNLKREYDSSLNAFDKYFTARIDIKNENLNNHIKIIENSDEFASIDCPKWFEDNLGKGLCIHSKKRNIKLKIKCYGNGELFIRFRGMDIKDFNGNKIPIYIKYISIFINGKKINDAEKIVCHDNPYYYKSHVNDGEILTLNIKWDSF